MVVFTCNHCGDSLQKPKVVKHYQTTCSRNPINLTCVDCFKDFSLQEFVVHTKCCTEEDRYSAKGTALKILKGEVKQTEWVNTVNLIIEQQKNAKPGVKNLLEALTTYDNIPRKKVKFLNFMRSTFKSKFNNRDIEHVWNLLEEQKNAAKKSNDEQKVENGKQKETTENLDESNQEKKSKKKKKKSESETVENGTNGVETSADKTKKSESEETVENGTSEVKTKKKRKSKQHDTENLNGIAETPQKLNEENGVDTSSKKKKKRKSQDLTTEETPQKKQNPDETVETNGTDTSSKKKKKRKSQDATTEETPQKKQKPDETIETNGTDSSSKKKKTSECEETNDSKLEDSQNESFSFKQVIVDILTKKSKGLTGEALQNKVFKKYEAVKGPIENKEILLKKYQKKLKALKNISCDNDKYKISSE